MNINVMQYLEQKPRLEDSWQADMVRLLDALNDYFMEIKTNTPNHVIHTRISEIQHALEHIAQEFLNTDKDETKEMGYGYFKAWQDKHKKYKKAHKESKTIKAAPKHPSYKAIQRSKSLLNALAKATEMLIKQKKFRNVLLPVWFKLMAQYLTLMATYEKLK